MRAEYYFPPNISCLEENLSLNILFKIKFTNCMMKEKCTQKNYFTIFSKFPVEAFSIEVFLEK